jgi:hypothetical protein
MLMKTKEKAFARGRKKELGPRTGASDLAMSSIKMLKMKDDPAICMKKNVESQNDWRKSGRNCISEQEFGDIFDLLGANRDRWRLFCRFAIRPRNSSPKPRT